MKKDVKVLFAAKIEGYRLPRYCDLPNVGLYLEQVINYINGVLLPLGCNEITPSMVSNYVKKGVIMPPVKKKYYAEQIGYLIFIALGKSVISIEHITELFALQKDTYKSQVAYDYFCNELENMLMYICGVKNELDEIGTTNSQAKTLFRSVIAAASQVLFINNCFEEMKQ